MISFLLILLKILGIILLSLIGIVVVLVLLVMFVPVRYKFKGYYKEEFVCHGKVTWLLRLLAISVDYEKELITSIRILGIPLSVFTKKKKDKKEDTVLPDKTGIKEASGKEEKTEIKTIDTEKVPKVETVSDSNCENSAHITKTESEIPKKESVFKKIKRTICDLIEKIKAIIKKIKDLLEDIKNKKEKLTYYISILKREEVKKAFSFCKKRVGIILKRLLPQRIIVTAKLGFDDPSTTGYVLAVHGLLPMSRKRKIVIHPDFDNAVMEGDFFIKGAVNSWSILHQLLCVLFDKNCRALYHIVKKEILNERK